MQRLSCVLAVALAACSSSTAVQTMPAAAADGPSCAEAADHAMDLLAKAATDARPALVKNIRETLVAHCDNDRWSVATRTCFAKVASMQDEHRCEDSLSDAQRQALAKDHVRDDAGPSVGGGAPPDSAAVPSSTRAAPPPPPPGETRSPIKKSVPKKGGDPEDGGE